MHTIDSENLRAADTEHLWHPFTQHASWPDEPPLVIGHAEGTTLYDTDGKAYIDGTSSLWCNIHGHRHPKIDAAIRDQLDRVAHSTMLGLTHAPAIDLARRLVELTPAGLSRVFYSDSGATAVEVALKMAYQYWQHVGESKRTRFVSLRDAYHGDTIGSVSLGGMDVFHSAFRSLLFDTFHAGPGDIESMRAIFVEHGDELAAVVIEPLVQGAGGMIIHPDGYLRAVRTLCDEFGVLLICDEVAVGFGRTGTLFACEQEGVSPDFLCVAKGITGGYLPLAATLATERVYSAFLGKHEEFKTFFHGHTYTGNPLGCAAAIASLDLFVQERTLEGLQPKIRLLKELLDAHVGALESVREVRQRGFMVGIELVDFPPAQRMGHRVTLAARKLGAIVRPLGDVVVLMPPLAIGERDLQRLVEITGQAIRIATGQVKSAPPPAMVA